MGRLSAIGYLTIGGGELAPFTLTMGCVMGKLAFTVGGTIAGSFIGQPALGAGAGGLIGSLLYPPDDIVQEGSRVNNQATTASAYGMMRPWGYGVYVVSGNIIDGSDRRIIQHSDKQSSGGKGGGPKVVTVWETAERDLAVGLGQGPISGVLRIYANEQLIWDATPGSTVRSPEWLDVQIYLGTETQEPDPTLESIYGVGNVPAYRGEAYVMFRKFQLEAFNNTEPSFRFVVVRNGTSGTNEVILDPGLGYSGGNLLYDRNRRLMHFTGGKLTAGGDPPGDVLGFIYDPNVQKAIITYTWPTDFTQLDEGAGASLFSIPTLVDGVPVSLGANAHLIVHGEKTGVVYWAIYDASNGAYIGDIYANLYSGVNTTSITADETRGIIYQETFDASAFYSFLNVIEFEITSGTVSELRRDSVAIPIANRDGIGQWSWDGDPSVPEGTTRAGKILVKANDQVDTKTYLCLIDVNNRAWVEKYVEVTANFDTVNTSIIKIVWDSVQELFWCIGRSTTGLGWTRFVAYDLDLNIVYNSDHNITLYTFPDYITYDAATKIIYLFVTSTLYRYDTTSQTFLDNLSGWTGTSSPTDTNMQYHAPTRTVWRKGNDKIYLYQLDQLSVNTTTLDEIIDDICDRAGLASAQYKTDACSSITVEGYWVDTGGSYRSKLLPLLSAYLVYGVDKESYIEFLPYSTNVVAQIPERDLAASIGDEPRALVDVERLYEEELPYKVEVTYYNANAEYEQGSQAATRKANFSLSGKQSFVYPIVLTDDEAAALADVKIHMAHVARLRFKLSLMPKWRWLAGADLIRFTDDNGVGHIARIMRKEFVQGVVQIEAERFDPSVLTSFLSGVAVVGRTTAVLQNTLMLVSYLDAPLFREQDDDAGFYAAATAYSSTFNGGSVYKSPDGTGDWTLVKSFFGRSRVGRVIEAMPAPENHHVWDATTSVTVDMVSGELESAAASAVVRGANLCLIGGHGRWEACRFADKTLVSAGRYSVTNFLRGRYGTEHAMEDHIAGDTLVMISEGDLQYFQDQLANLSVERVYRAVPFGADLYGFYTVDTRFINRGVCMEPYAPDPFQADKDYSTLDITFDWQERTRYRSANAWTGTASETSASFSLDVKDAAGSVVGTYATTGNEFVYARASQVADGFSSVISETGSFEVFQISDRVGRGYGAVISGFALGPPPPRFQEYAIDKLGADQYFPLNDATTGNNEWMTNAVANGSSGQYKGASISAQVTTVFTGPYPGVATRLDNQAGLDGRKNTSALSSTRTATIGIVVNFEEALTEDMLLTRLNLGTPLGDLRIYLSSTGIMSVYGASAGTSAVYATATTTIVNGSDYYLAGSIGASGVKAYVNGAMEKAVTTGPSQMADPGGNNLILWHGYRFSQAGEVNKHRAAGFHGFARQLSDAEVSTLNTKR